MDIERGRAIRNRGLVLLLIVAGVGVVRPTPVEAECQEFKLIYLASCNHCVWQAGDCTGC